MIRSSDERIEPKYLVPLARAAWDGWFAISIFPKGSPVRWLKAHMYSRNCGPGPYPFSLVEGLGENTEVMVAWANEDAVEIRQSEVTGGPAATESPLMVSFGENFSLLGDWPLYQSMYSLPGGHTTAHFDFEAGWPIWWSKFGPMLQYVGQHSKVAVEFAEGDESLELEGFGVIEHVAGAAASFDITKAVPGHFHWDVLVFDEAETPVDSAAGLSLGARGATLLPLKAVAQFPGGAHRGMRGLWVRYLEMTCGLGPDGRDMAFPVGWQGVMRNMKGTFRYEATAATPVAKNIPGGGMLGFDFEGKWTSAGTPPKTLSGYGFNEYGDFGAGLVHLANR
ncbi:MAG TPA: hypothetical protein VIK02_00490 [Candidatus Anoxymicrobiaceae bacterium]